MFRRIGTKIAVIATAIVLPAGTSIVFGASPALADYSSAQICNSVGCLNAWGGGPWTNLETSMGEVPNDEFGIHTLSNGNTYIEFVGGGSWSGECVGDAYNEQGNYATSLDPCPTNSNSGGWGTNFKAINCSDEGALEFKDNHTGEYLAPSGSTNGDNFSLTGAPDCFGIYDPSEKN